MLTRISDLKPGDIVDLQGDRYADSEPGDHPEYEFEYAVVDEIIIESTSVTTVVFRDCAVGFPPDHEVSVEGHDKRYD